MLGRRWPPRTAAVQRSVGADAGGDAARGSSSATCGRRAPNALRPLGDLFIQLVRMIVAPIIFCTVVHGIASVGEARRVGRVAVKALIYFEIVTTLRAGAGPRAGEYVWAPGVGMNVRSHDRWQSSDVADVAAVSEARRLRRVPPQRRARRAPSGAFADGDVTARPVLLGDVRLRAAGHSVRRDKPMVDAIHSVSQVLFKMIAFAMYVAPIGAFGAIAFTVGRVRPVVAARARQPRADVLRPLRAVRPAGAVAHRVGVRDQPAAIDPLHRDRADDRRRHELERVGVSATARQAATAGRRSSRSCRWCCPTGYALQPRRHVRCTSRASRCFCAQAVGIQLSIGQQLGLLAILLVTSKGGAGVAGSAIVVLASTLSATGTIPVASVGLILGVHRLLSSAFVPVNVLGNAVATLAIARMEQAIDVPTFESELHRRAGSDVAMGSRRGVSSDNERGGKSMVIDCHGHYTTVPQEVQAFRRRPDCGLREERRR